MVGGVGSSAGYGGGEDVADRSSWLEEDDDVWGGGGDARPASCAERCRLTLSRLSVG